MKVNTKLTEGHPTALRYASFRDVCLVPPENKLTAPVQGGLAEPELFPSFVRHQRGGKVADTAVLPKPEPALYLKGTYIYGGFGLHHFGHLIAESLSRLWVTSLNGMAELPVLFLISPDNMAAKPHLEAAMQYFGISNYQILTESVKVEALVLAEMGKQLRSEPHADYVKWLGAIQKQYGPLGIKGHEKLCVLRGHVPAGKIAGEDTLERLLAVAGYHIFRPEDHPFADQLHYYANAQKIIFSEGSAIHMCDLLPALQADVAVLNRRPLSVLAETSLRGKANSLFILPASARVLSPRSETSVGYNRALSFIPPKIIQAFLSRHGFTNEVDWPENWDAGLLVHAATSFCKSQLPATNSTDMDTVVETLMNEVSVHFRLLRETRYKLMMTNAYLAARIGDYVSVISFAEKALLQVPGCPQAKALLVAATIKHSREKGWLGRLWGRVQRSVSTLMGDARHRPVKFPEDVDVTE